MAKKRPVKKKPARFISRVIAPWDIGKDTFLFAEGVTIKVNTIREEDVGKSIHYNIGRLV